MIDPTVPAPGRLFIFGLGYTALRLAARLRQAGWTVAGTVRNGDRATALRADGIDAFAFDRDRPLNDPAAALAGASHILSSVPPDALGDPVTDTHGADIAALSPQPRWVGYLSTTGVYGDSGGGWVDETSPLAATGPRGLRRVKAEDAWLSLWRDHAVPVHIFRLPGIYGPGRSAIDALRAGTARRVDKPGQVFGRIHVDDIGGALMASMAGPQPGTAYNITDDEPAASADVVAHAAALLGIAAPPLIPFEPGTMSDMAASFYADNRRVRNDRMKTMLGYHPVYRSYREGLAAQLAGEHEAGPDNPVTEG